MDRQITHLKKCFCAAVRRLFVLSFCLLTANTADAQDDNNPLRYLGTGNSTLTRARANSPIAAQSEIIVDYSVQQSSTFESIAEPSVADISRSAYVEQLDHAVLMRAGQAASVPPEIPTSTDQQLFSDPQQTLSSQRSQRQPTLFDSSRLGSAFRPMNAEGASAEPTPNETKTKKATGLLNLELDSTVKKIILNTLLVLAVAVAFVYGLRKSKRGQASASTKPKPAIGIEQTLALGNKATLKLVRVGDHQVLIAMDSSGVKSVVSLHEPFMQSVEDNLDRSTFGPETTLPTPTPSHMDPSQNKTKSSDTPHLLLEQLERLDPEFRKWFLLNHATVGK